MAAVGKAVASAAAVKPAPVAWDPFWARFAGHDRSEVSDQKVVFMTKRLVLINPGRPTIDASVKLEPLGGGGFRRAAPGGEDGVGAIVTRRPWQADADTQRR